MSDRRTKFYLDKQNGKFLGVCAGVADFTGIDVTLVRLAVAALVIFGGGTPAVLYFVAAFIANDKPRYFAEADNADREEKKFWQAVRAKPGNSIRDVRSRFRDIDRRLADVELHLTSQNRRLAEEIESLR